MRKPQSTQTGAMPKIAALATGGPSRNTQSLSEQAYAAIEEMIVMQELAPGMMVSEAELVEQLDCGRTPIREALLRLKLEGYIEVHPRRGALVTSVDIVRQLELLEARRPLEELVARLAALRATAEERRQCKVLSRDIRKAAKANDRRAFYEANKAIHGFLEAAAHNSALAKTIGAIHAHSRRFWYAHIGLEYMSRAAEHHAETLDQIARGDGEAAAKAALALMDYLEVLTRQAIDRRT